MDYHCAKFGDFSFSRFDFIVRMIAILTRNNVDEITKCCLFRNDTTDVILIFAIIRTPTQTAQMHMPSAFYQLCSLSLSPPKKLWKYPVCLSVCMSVCVCVCLFVTRISQKTHTRQIESQRRINAILTRLPSATTNKPHYHFYTTQLHNITVHRSTCISRELTH